MQSHFKYFLDLVQLHIRHFVKIFAVQIVFAHIAVTVQVCTDHISASYHILVTFQLYRLVKYLLNLSRLLTDLSSLFGVSQSLDVTTIVPHPTIL